MHRSNTRVRLLDTPFLEFHEVNYFDHNSKAKKWYGVSRKNDTSAVEVVALTPDNELILVTQYRPYIGSMSIELPAGLMDVAGESPVDTAIRELLEETGYAGEEARHLLGREKGLTISAGLTDERLHLVFIKNCVKVAEPLDDEGTTAKLVPFDNAYTFLATQAWCGDYSVSYPIFGTISLIKLMMNGEL